MMAEVNRTFATSALQTSLSLLDDRPGSRPVLLAFLIRQDMGNRIREAQDFPSYNRVFSRSPGGFVHGCREDDNGLLSRVKEC